MAAFPQKDERNLQERIIIQNADIRHIPFADSVALTPMTTPPLPEHIELHRDRMWRPDEELRVESAVDAERFIEDAGFAIR